MLFTSGTRTPEQSLTLERMPAMKISFPADLRSFSSEGPKKVPLAEGSHARVTLWCLEPGQEIHPHAHAGDHVWTVQDGEGWFLSGADAHAVAAGALVFAPAGEVHGMRAKTRLAFLSVSAG